jgi:PAS domain S-box-containing protein
MVVSESRIGRFILFSIIYFLLLLLDELLNQSKNDFLAVHFVNGLLFALGLIFNKRLWYKYILLALVINIVFYYLGYSTRIIIENFLFHILIILFSVEIIKFILPSSIEILKVNHFSTVFLVLLIVVFSIVLIYKFFTIEPKIDFFSNLENYKIAVAEYSGTLFLTVLILSWEDKWKHAFKKKYFRNKTIVGIFFASILFVILIFWFTYQSQILALSLLLYMFPVVFIAAYFLRTRYFSIFMLLLVLTVSLFTNLNKGPITAIDEFDRSFFLQVYLLLLFIPGFILSLIKTEKDSLNQNIRETEGNYRRALVEKVRNRTIELENALAKLRLREKELEESQERLNLLFKTMTQGVVYQDKTGAILLCNAAAEEILGLSFDQMVGRKSIDPHWKSIHPDGTDFPGEEHPAMQSIRTGEIVENAIMGVFHPISNEYKWLKVYSYPQKDKDGIVELVYTTFEDITKTRNYQKQLEESEKRVNSIIQNTPAIVFRCLIDESWTMKFISDQVEVISGYEAEEFIDNNKRTFSSIKHPDDTGSVEDAIHLSIKEKRAYKIEYRVIDNKNNIHWVLEHGQAYFNESNIAVWIDGVINDITDKKEAELRITRYADVQGELLREVNHRVKNNLAAIVSILHIEQDKALKIRECDYYNLLSDLVFRIQSLATVHTMLSASNWDPISLYDLCKNVIENNIKGNRNLRDISLVVDVDECLIQSEQAHHLALVLSELAINTIKHSISQKEALELRVSNKVDKEKKCYILTYRDNGPGFSKDVIKEESGSFNTGLELVFGLVRQSLDSEIYLRNDNGAVAELHLNFNFLTC